MDPRYTLRSVSLLRADAAVANAPSGKPSLAAALRFLTAPFEPRDRAWEFVETAKKLLLVGLMSVVLPGSLNQLVIGFIIALCFQTVLLVAKPYKRPEDDVLALGKLEPRASADGPQVVVTGDFVA